MIQSELKMIAERLKQIWDKLRVVLGAIGLLLLSNLPVILLDSSRGLIPPQFKNGFLLLIAVLAGLIIWYCWRRAEKLDLKIWDPEILSWRGLGMVLAGYIAMVVCDSLALHLMNLQGIETSAKSGSHSATAGWCTILAGPAPDSCLTSPGRRSHLSRLSL